MLKKFLPYVAAYCLCATVGFSSIAIGDDQEGEKTAKQTADKSAEDDEAKTDPPSYELKEDATIEEIEAFVKALVSYRPEGDNNELRKHMLKARTVVAEANQKMLALLEEAGETDSERYFGLKRDSIGQNLSSLRNPEKAEEVLQSVVQFFDGLGDKIGPQDSRLGVMACYYLSGSSVAKETTDAFFTDVSAALRRGGEATLKDAEMVEGIARRANLVGQTFELSGTKMNGDKFDIQDLKGKVVLVDFWATWCGPCIREHPNIEKNYERFGDLGFEVVGLSVDRDREALEKFVEEKETKWIILHDKDGRNPASTYYGVVGIPSMFLLDQEGKVVSTNARGDKLEEELIALLGKPEGEEESTTEESVEESGASEESSDTSSQN